MKRILIAGALALAAGGQALAADLPQPAPAPPRAPAAYIPAPPIYNWGGFYLGINGGYGFGNSNWTNPAGSTGNFNTGGFLVGGQTGFNFQVGPWVFGAEVDGDWNDANGSSGAGCGAPATTCETKSVWLATARGRLGYALDRVLFYVTGGGAAGDVEGGITGSGNFNSNTEFGWTAGAGIEGAIAPNWTVRVEYLFVDLGSNASCTTACAGTFAAGANIKFDESLIRGGVNYKFNF